MPKYRPALPPRDHQKRALRRIARPNRYGDVFALLMEMGTGKSKVVCDEWGARVVANKLSDLLIIAPAGCYSNWIDDHEESPSEFRKQLDPALFKRTLFVKWVSGMGVNARARLNAMLETRNRPRVFVVNAEALSRGDKATNACRAFLDSSQKGAMVVIDESPLMKGKDSIRTDTILELGEHKKIVAKRILSGLVTPNSPLDLYTQFQFLDWHILGFRSFYGFRARYAIMQDIPIGVWFDEKGERHERMQKIVVNYRNTDELHGKIEPFSFRCLKSECLNLPPKQYISRDIELTKDQKRIYKELQENAFAKLADEKFVTVNMVLTQRMRLAQVLCGFTMDDEKKEIHEISERRSSATLELLSDYSGKAIIWTSHDYCVRKLHRIITEEFGQGSCAQFWGGNRPMRGEEELRFKTDPECRFLVATPAAGGKGNNWTVAGLSIYHDNSDSLDYRLQSEDRNHREGLTAKGGAQSVLYVDLIARGTIDVKRLKLLRNKINIATQIHGDSYREWLI